MLNLMWTTEGQAVVKEEQEVCSEPGSPLLLDSLQDDSPYGHEPTYGVAVSLSADAYYYPESAGSPQLQLLQPLPSFHCLPSSPRKSADYPVVSVQEFTPGITSLVDCSMALHSPDSSSGCGGGGSSGGGHVTVSMLPLGPPLHDSTLRRRKRSNSGSSGSSGTSSTSKSVKRRRPPISHEELMNQRNQGKIVRTRWCNARPHRRSRVN